MRVRIIGRGIYYRELIGLCNEDVGDWRAPDVLVNWGLAGQRWRDHRIHSELHGSVPIVNYPVNLTKYSMVGMAKEAGIPCPYTMRMGRYERPNGLDGIKWLFKPYFSLGGRYICLEEDYMDEVPGYYQEFIPGADRRYELRVHACNWRKPSEFLCQKRVHNDPSQITWNHHTGGRFVTVNNPLQYNVFTRAQIFANMALKAIGLDFGGVDFIVTHNGDILFLEINTALGFTLEASRVFWTDSMNQLTEGAYDETTN